MELRNRVRKPIDNELFPELEDINREFPFLFFSLQCCLEHLRSLEFISGLRLGYPRMESNHIINIKKQLEKLLEKFSKTSRTTLSKEHLTDIIDSMNTLRVTSVVREDSDGLLDGVERYCPMFDEMIVISWQKLLDDPSCEELVEKVWYAVVVSTAALLSSVYQYLLGYVLKGGTKAYSSGSLDFRDTFVSLLLFQGSYVWIFFRDVAPRKVYRRSKKDEVGRVLSYYGKYEPRFKPPREKLRGGTSIKLDHLPLGGYDSERDAEIVCQIAGFYYMRDEGEIELRDGSFFTIPAVPSSEQEQSLCGKPRAQWVAARAKEVFRDFQLKNNAINLPSESNAVGVHGFFQEFSLDALWDAADIVDSEFVSNLCPVGEGLEGTVTSPNSSADLSFVDSLIAVEESSEGTPPSPSTAEQDVPVMEHPQSLNIESNDVDSVHKRENLTQQQREHLEAEFKRRIAEQHEEHIHREKQLEEQKAKLQLENEERISALHLEFEFLRSLLR